ncbi:MAG: hypothetical protein H0X33_01720 [Taibaiella sp.]|nr:hypothetical protein [Taibaiella sp.]
MKLFKYALLVAALFMASKVPAQISLQKPGSIQQGITDPTTWSYEVKKHNANEYELIFHLKLKEAWHVWSLRPGGDGLEIAPSFTFDKNNMIHLAGDVTENGRPVVTTMTGIDGKVTYYKDGVDYTQIVQVKGTAVVTGKHLYQVCSDEICLPPKTLSFRFELK